MFTVLLKDGTIGNVDCLVVKEGQLVTVELDDENGETIQVIGEIAEILEDITDYDYSY